MAHLTAQQAETTGPAKQGLDRGIGIWLMTVALFIALIVVVGGLTRLTDSGLSITEWKPITGALPPLSEAHWQDEFQKYQQIPEFHQVNSWMSLSDFKWIYWWEWGHRLLARMVGFIFLVPFIYFWVKGRIPRNQLPKFVGLFILGGMQGALGWYMVSSGLTERIDVSQYRLAAHMGLAVILFSAIFWTGLGYLVERKGEGPPVLAVASRLLVGIVFIQIITGAFVAGTHAGYIYNTWPLIDGAFIPDAAFATEAAMFEDHLTIQFNHRMFAYFTLFAVFAVWYAARGKHVVLPERAAPAVNMLMAVGLLQVVLGIATLVLVVPVPLAALHQLGAVGLMASALYAAYRLSPQ